MKLLYITILSAYILSTTSMVTAAPEVSSGTIHFSGYIVESTCTIASNNSQLSSNCFKNGTMRSTTLPIKAMQTSKGIASDQYTANMVWLNKEKTIAVTTISYR